MGADEFIGGAGGGGGGCSIAQSSAPVSIPLYLLIPVFVVMTRVWRRYRS
ncbi:MAG: hypothetical protein HYW01_02950 [Deltaproteobacteria bacterium]|nr:hypothetical protein [Deltaproteobacteria bacterium]